VATIFIPLSFLAGLWGMNFDTHWPFNMPELRWKYGYPMALGIMMCVAGGMVLFFRRRGWLGRSRAR
jgi:magnesium transporter